MYVINSEHYPSGFSSNTHTDHLQYHAQLYERKQSILGENGVPLSESMYTTYEILPTEILAAMTLLVGSVVPLSFFTHDENVIF